jgi:glucose/arabinose dehydrogenase
MGRAGASGRTTRRRGTGPSLERLEGRILLATLPPGFVQSAVVEGLTGPTAMEFAPDGRIFVAEHRGTVRLIRDGAILPDPVLSLPLVEREDRGLLGLTLDPDFERNGYVYVYYTQPGAGAADHNRVSRFRLVGDAADPASEAVLLDLEPLPADTSVHYGGSLHFGADGKLYIGVGDNGNPANAQSLGHLGGKLLRINPDGSIPADNPFVAATTGVHQAIWALGLRNPFTFAVQPGTGRIHVNDVGLATTEEINLGRAGANYGWSLHEGAANQTGYDDPIYSYQHGTGPAGACAITGGVFYAPSAGRNFPADFAGDYLFADLCGRWIRRLDPATGGAAPFASDLHAVVVDLDTDASGNLYYLTWKPDDSAGIYRISYDPASPPVLEPVAPERTVTAGDDVTFVIEASGPSALRYQWQRDGVDIPGATGESYTLARASSVDAGTRYRVVVTNDNGRAISPEITLRVLATGRPAVAITPVQGLVSTAGTPLSFAASAVDPEDGPLPASSLTWRVDHHHNEHTHPVVPPTSGQATFAFTPPQTPREAGVHWFRVTLTAVDSSGLATTAFVDVVDRRLTVVGRAYGRATDAGIRSLARRPRLSGTASPGTTVRLVARDGAGNDHPLGQVHANRRGRWVLRGPRLSPGTYRVLATATDATGASTLQQPLWPRGAGALKMR